MRWRKRGKNTRTKSAEGSGLTGLTEIRGRGLSGWLTGVLCRRGKSSGTRAERRRVGRNGWIGKGNRNGRVSNRGDEKQKKEERIERKRKREVREASKCGGGGEFWGGQRRRGAGQAREVGKAREEKRERRASRHGSSSNKANITLTEARTSARARHRRSSESSTKLRRAKAGPTTIKKT